MLLQWSHSDTARLVCGQKTGTEVSDLGVPQQCMDVILSPPSPSLGCAECIKKVGCCVANILWLLQFDLFYPDLLVHLA